MQAPQSNAELFLLQLLTPQEVCKQLAISRKTLQRLTNDRKIAFCYVGGQVRFRDAAVELFVKQSERLALPAKR